MEWDSFKLRDPFRSKSSVTGEFDLSVGIDSQVSK